jgi:glutathione S-transferase
MKKLELVSFDLCPFVQRAVITLNRKHIHHDITYIDLSDKPDWFVQLSPLGKVPILKIDNDVLFESAVINEYLDEISGGDLMPDTPIEKAKVRAWSEFSGQLLMDSYVISITKSEEEFESRSKSLRTKLEHMENSISSKGPYFLGEHFCLVDTSLAPFFTRLFILKAHFDIHLLDNLPKTQKLGATLIALDEVKNSVKDDFEERFISYIQKAEGIIVTS